MDLQVLIILLGMDQRVMILQSKLLIYCILKKYKFPIENNFSRKVIYLKSFFPLVNSFQLHDPRIPRRLKKQVTKECFLSWSIAWNVFRQTEVC